MTERAQNRSPSATHRRSLQLALVTATMSAALLAAAPLQAQVTLTYNCQLDLHQGDTGSLELTRTSDALTGTVTVSRGIAAPLTTTISGTWSANAIAFTRVLSSTSSQPFAGVAMRSTDRSVRMAGRFASEFAGLWSADCTRAGDGPLPVEPSGAVVPAASGSCSISGAANGPRADVTPAFRLLLFGPDEDKRLRATLPLGSRQFTFANLPDGRYILVPDTKADVAVGITPRRAVVTCRGAAVAGVNFEFR